MLEKCSKTVQATGNVCGDDIDGPFHTRFCSERCADQINKSELENLGITTTMMRGALADYYKCRDLINQQEVNNSLSNPSTTSHTNK
jgi:hypothetical protein